jgi:hypothetical protein
MKRIIALVCTAGLCIAPAVLAQDSASPARKIQDAIKDTPKTVDEAAKKAQDAAKKAVDEAMAATGDDMAAWMQASMPGENHKLIATLAGDWNAEVIMMEPGGHAEKFTGTLSSKMEFDGRFLYSHYTGDFGGMPFHGVGMLGFNNVDERFESFWTDSMSSGMMMASGAIDASRKVITLNSQHTAPGSKQKVQSREVWTLVSPDKYTIDMYHTKDGAEERVMTITYTRGKGGKGDAGSADSR